MYVLALTGQIVCCSTLSTCYTRVINFFYIYVVCIIAVSVDRRLTLRNTFTSTFYFVETGYDVYNSVIR